MQRRVLIVDDDPLVLAAHARALRARFEVWTADGPRDAQRVLAQQPAFDAIVCDVRMPDGGGLGLYTEVVRTRPAYVERFWFVTGSAPGDPAVDAATRTGRPVHSKPLSADVLEALLAG